MRHAAQQAMPNGAQLYAGPVRVVITYYHDGERPIVDTDNIIKPIQDALSGVVYVDDRQVTNSDCGRCRIDEALRVRGMSVALALAFSAGREFVHIKVDHPRDPQELRR